MKPAAGGGLNFGRIAKPLRGGGGGVAAGTPTSPGYTAGASAASPLGPGAERRGRYVNPLIPADDHPYDGFHHFQWHLVSSPCPLYRRIVLTMPTAKRASWFFSNARGS